MIPLSFQLARPARALRSLLACGAVLFAIDGCAPARPPLPPPPPPKPLSELEQWKNPPPLAADRTVLDLKVDSTSVALDNGLKVTVITRPATTTTSVVLWVPEAGDWTDGPVSFTADALRSGTDVNGEILVNPRLDFQPVLVATNAAGTTLRWSILPEGTKKALELLGAFVSKPTFEPDATIAKLRSSVNAIQRYAASGGILDRVAEGALVGDLPTAEQDARALIKLQRTDFQAIHACTMVPARAELVVIGPAPGADVASWARASFASWKAAPASGCERWRNGGPSLTKEPQRLSRTQLAIVYLIMPDPSVSILLPGPAIDSEDYLAYVVLARALAWRALTQDDTLRHEGATYTVSANIDDGYENFSLLQISGVLETSVARDSLRRLVEDAWNLSEALTEADLDSAKRMLRTELLGDLAFNASFAERALWLRRQGKDAGKISESLDVISGIDLARARQVAQRWLKDNKPSILMRSMPQKITAGLGLDVQLRELILTKAPQAYKKAGAAGDGSAAP